MPYVTEHVRFAIDNRMVTLLILFDFTKTFDTVPHAPLLLKLSSLGCDDNVICWFASYLSGREHAVLSSDSSKSNWLSTSSGVPQGSVLGPLLFSVFVNDLPLTLTQASHVIFADDLQLLLSCLPANLEQGISNITAEASSIATWAASNGLHLNASKMKEMLLGSDQYLSRMLLLISLRSDEFRSLNAQYPMSKRSKAWVLS